MKTKIASLLLCVLLLSACGANKSNAPIPTIVLDPGQATPQATSPAGIGSLNGSVAASGVVVADQEAQLAFKVGGNVQAVKAAPGDQVKAGQLLVQLDDTAQQIAVDQANQALLELTSPAAIAAAQMAVAQDQQNLSDDQVAYNNLYAQHSNQALIDNAKAGLVLAQNALNDAQSRYDSVPGDPNRDAGKAQAYQMLYAAQQSYNHALYIYNLYTGKFNQTEIDRALAQVALDKARLAEDQILLTALTGGDVPAQATGIGYSKLVQARLNLEAAQASLDAARLTAPFDGTIVSVSAAIGEFASPGETIVVISDVNHLHVETTDLSERDVPSVHAGQSVTVSVKALNRTISGKVAFVSPLATSLGGDVVYKVRIELDEIPPDLLSGMSVDVQFLEK
jgi:multidrug efflux pump subunit AcrA (membrane-fusion protein)